MTGTVTAGGWALALVCAGLAALALGRLRAREELNRLRPALITVGAFDPVPGTSNTFLGYVLQLNLAFKSVVSSQ